MTTETNPDNKLPLNPGYASPIFSLVLVGLKLAGVLAIPWWLALLPVYFWYGLALTIPLVLLAVLIAAIPIISLALLAGPVIERIVGRNKTPEVFIASSITTHPASAQLHIDLPDGAVEDGTLVDHDGDLFGYAKPPKLSKWIGPRNWIGTKSCAGRFPTSDNTKFAHAKRPTDSADAHDQAA